jgi:PAS domain S-box-containing protein
VLKETTGRAAALIEAHFQPLRAADGAVSGAFCVLRNVTAQESARRDLEALGAELEQKVAERTSQLATVVTELERRKAEAELQRERLRAVLNALPVGVWIADANGQFVARNEAGREIWGEDAPMSARTEDYGRDYRGWWPDGRELTSEDWALARAIRYGEVAEAQEIEIASWDGRRRVVLNYALPIRDAAGAIAGGVAVNVDITDRRRAQQALLASEQQYRRLAAELLERERTIRQQLAEIEAIYDAAPVGLGVFDRELRFVRLNERLAEINGLPRAAHIGRTVREMVPALADVVEPLFRQVLETGEPVLALELAGETAAQPGVRRYWLEHYHPLRLASGEVVGVTATIEEITERKHAELAKQFLSDASAALASSIEYEETLARVARLAIPFLADYCIVDLLREDDVLVRVAGAHSDPALQPVLDRLLRYTARLDEAGVMARVLRSGVAEVVEQVDGSSLGRDVGERQEIQDAVRALGPQSYLCVPMAAGGQRLGTITLVYSSSGRRYTEAEREVAVELGRRAGMAVSNAKLYATTQGALVEAQAASLTKSQFLATMSHELRTPLTGIIGYTELLDEEVTGPLTQVQRQQLSRIKASAWHLVTIIDEILLYARMEAGREQVRSTVFDLGALVQECVFMLEQQATVRGLGLGAVLPPEPLLVESDQGKLRQVLINLVGNAVKFTDQGEVRVVVAAGQGSALVRVRDTGPGIPPDQQQRIFEAFTQADGSSTRRKGGTGLGLTVSRRLAELLGGSLELEATSAEGSTFLLTLPLHPQRP